MTQLPECFAVTLANPAKAIQIGAQMLGGQGPMGPPGPPGTDGNGGPVAQARYQDNSANPGYGSGGIRPSEIVYGSAMGDGNVWAYDNSYGVLFMQDGWYQVSVDAHVTGLNDNDIVRIQAILHVTGWFGDVQGWASAPVTGAGPGQSDVYVTATSPVFWAQAQNYVEIAVSTVNVTSTNSAIEAPGINLVHFESGTGASTSAVTAAGVVNYVGIGEVRVDFPPGLFTATPVVVASLADWTAPPDATGLPVVAATYADATRVFLSASLPNTAPVPACAISWIAVQVT